MKPARSSATAFCHFPTTRRSRRRCRRSRHERALWTVDDMAAAMRARQIRRAAGGRAGALDRQPHVGRAMPSSPSRATTATATISSRPRSRPAPVLPSSHARKRARFAADAPLLAVDDVLEGLRDLARAARARSNAKIIAVTGSVGKTGTKEALRLALSADGETHASAASYNNHWGVPLSLARCPATREVRRVRNRHEPCRRDHAADAIGAPACRDRHHDRAGASGIFRLARKDRRRQGGDFFRAGAGRRRRAQPRQRAICAPRRRRQGGRRQPHRHLRRTRRGRRAAQRFALQCRKLHRRGGYSRRSR